MLKSCKPYALIPNVTPHLRQCHSCKDTSFGGALNKVNMHNDISRQNKNICIYVNRVNNIDKTAEDFILFQNKSGTA